MLPTPSAFSVRNCPLPVDCQERFTKEEGARRMRRLITLMLAAGMAAASARAGVTAKTRGPERIVFVSFRPGNWDIYYFDKPGSAPRPLTDDFGLDYDPTLSPDGRWVVFCSERRGNADLYALDLKNGGPPR